MLYFNAPKTPVVIRISCNSFPFEEQRDEMLRRLWGPTLHVHNWDARNVHDHWFLEKLKEELTRVYTNEVHVVGFELVSTRECHAAILALARMIATLTYPVLFPVYASRDGSPYPPFQAAFVVSGPDAPVRFLCFANLKGVTPHGGPDLDGHSLVY
jgi:hypothetical protein